MPAVEQRNRKKVGQPDAYGKDSRQIEKRPESRIPPLAGSFWRSPRGRGTGRRWHSRDHLADARTVVLHDVPASRRRPRRRRPPGHSIGASPARWRIGRTPITTGCSCRPERRGCVIGAGVTQTVRACRPRQMSMARVWPPLTAMISGSCWKSVIAVPSMAVTRSPGLMPAASAALPLATSPMIGRQRDMAAVQEQAGQQHDGQNEIGEGPGRRRPGRAATAA